MITPPTTIDDATAETMTRNLGLAGAFTQTVLNDPAVMDHIPSGVTIIFLPEDDPSFIETNIRVGIAAIRRGEDVYFLHVHSNEDGTLSISRHEENDGQR